MPGRSRVRSSGRAIAACPPAGAQAGRPRSSGGHGLGLRSASHPGWPRDTGRSRRRRWCRHGRSTAPPDPAGPGRAKARRPRLEGWSLEKRIPGRQPRPGVTPIPGATPETQKSWRRPIFPKGCPLSIFGAGELDFRVRDGNGYGLSASVTRISCVWTSFGSGSARGPRTGGAPMVDLRSRECQERSLSQP